MKTFILSLCFFFFTFSLSAQRYQAIIDTSLEWQTRSCPVCAMYPFSAYSIKNISFVDQDTVINNQVYRKIDNYHVREDSGRVYIYDITRHTVNNQLLIDSTEKLAYDFNAEIGDTIYMNNPGYVSSSGEPYYYAILDVDSIMVNGTWRKRLEVYSNRPFAVTNRYYWIEGIGNSVYGLLSYWSPLMATNYYFCGVKNKTTKAVVFDNNSCTGFLSVPPVSSKHDNLYPNPTTGIVYWDRWSTISTDVWIYNTTGQLVKSYLSVSGHFSVSELERGVYFVVLKGEDGRSFKQKIIKI